MLFRAPQAATTSVNADFPTCYGRKFTSRDLDLWAYAKQVTMDFLRLGKPTDNGFIEAFNSKLRSKWLNAHWFMSLADAAEKLEDWRRHYTRSAIGSNVPSALHFSDDLTGPRCDRSRKLPGPTVQNP